MEIFARLMSRGNRKIPVVTCEIGGIVRIGSYWKKRR